MGGAREAGGWAVWAWRGGVKIWYKVLEIGMPLLPSGPERWEWPSWDTE